MHNLFSFIEIKNKPQLILQAANFFATHFQIPVKAYIDSMNESLVHDIPSWFIVCDEMNTIIAGVGVIENDFHNRKDLAPNLCALYVDKPYRRLGIAKKLIDKVKTKMKSLGLKKLYLVTDHIDLYEKMGWQFLTKVQDINGVDERLYQIEL